MPLPLSVLSSSTSSTLDPTALLRSQLAANESAIAHARRIHDDAALAAVDGKVTQGHADRTYDALQSSIQRRDRTASTLRAAEARAAEQARAAAREAQDAELSHCVTLAEKRAKAADATQAAIKHLAEMIDKQRQAEIELDRALPANFGTAKRDGLYLEADELRASVGHEFDRLQMFGGPPPWNDHRPFAVKFRESVDVMRRRRAALLGLPE